MDRIDSVGDMAHFWMAGLLGHNGDSRWRKVLGQHQVMLHPFLEMAYEEHLGGDEDEKKGGNEMILRL